MRNVLKISDLSVSEIDELISVADDIMAHPEKYKGLQVRVCGWNVLWNDLTRKEQDAYILRAETVTE